MWIRGAAIRPVPPHAVVAPHVLAEVEADVGEGESHEALTRWQARYDAEQPVMANRLALLLERPLDETALAVGFFLETVIYATFVRSFAARLRPVSVDLLRATEESVTVEEELRADHPEEPLEVDDVLRAEQPAIVNFIQEHIDAVLESGDDLDVTGRDVAGPGVDVDDLQRVYRHVMVTVLTLSHAVMAPSSYSPGNSGEAMA
jgi:hypothetical protein